MRTDELIVQLARAAGPVRPLPGPSVRLARWTAAAVPLAALGVIVIGPRKDILTAIYQPTFVWLALATLGTALLSATLPVRFESGAVSIDVEPIQGIRST